MFFIAGKKLRCQGDNFLQLKTDSLYYKIYDFAMSFISLGKILSISQFN